MHDKPSTQAIITIAMDNDAFQYTAATELSRILVKLADEIATDGVTYAALRDSNGNPIGHFQIKSETAPPEQQPDVQILRVLDLSTAHIDPKTMDLLDDTRKDAWPVCGSPLPNGYFIYAHDEDDPEIPRDLWACIEFARANDCSDLRFDCGGPVYEALPAYDYT